MNENNPEQTTSVHVSSEGYIRLSFANRFKLVRIAISTSEVLKVKTNYRQSVFVRTSSGRPDFSTYVDEEDTTLWESIHSWWRSPDLWGWRRTIFWVLVAQVTVSAVALSWAHCLLGAVGLWVLDQRSGRVLIREFGDKEGES